MKWLKRGALGFAVLLVLVVVSGFSSEQWFRWRADRAFPPPGEMVNVDGELLHLNCTGSGDPTVVLQAGAGTPSVVWSLVQPELAQFTRVCSYDRAGLGWSWRAEGSSDPERMVQEVHSVLEQASVEPPFVLVGHSLAGPLSMIFADLFPSEVAGLVFVDATDPDAGNRAPPELLFTEELAEELALRRTAMTLMAEFGLSRFMNRNFRAPQQRVAYIFDVGRRFNPQQVAAGAREVASLPAILDRASDAGPFGDIPIVVLTAERWNPGRLTPEQSQIARALRLELQAELAALSTNGEHRIVEDSGHTMMLDAADETTRAIREVVEAVRTGSGVGNLTGTALLSRPRPRP